MTLYNLKFSKKSKLFETISVDTNMDHILWLILYANTI